MALTRMNIKSVIVGGGPITSLVVLVPQDARDDGERPTLPIRIGSIEAAAISMGVAPDTGGRPMTHDLALSMVEALGGTVKEVVITQVQGTTFFAQVVLASHDGTLVRVDSRPSDALALAVRCDVPILADEDVLNTASLPDFDAIESNERQEQMEQFHNFVEGLSPDDFS